MESYTDMHNKYIEHLNKMINAREAKTAANIKDLAVVQKQVLDLLLKASKEFSNLRLGPRLVIRESAHAVPNKTFAPEFEFPPKEQLNFENPITGFQTWKIGVTTGTHGWNIIMKDGSKSTNSVDSYNVDQHLADKN